MILGMLNTKNPKVFLKHFSSTITALKSINIQNQDNSHDPKVVAKVANDFVYTIFGQRLNQCFGALFEQTMGAGIVAKKCGLALGLLQKRHG
jgi:hypothetical protein